MKTRPIEARDLPILEAIYNELDIKFDDGFPDFLSAQFEAVEVVVDAEDRPLMVAGMKKAVELVMICSQRPHVGVRMKGIALLHGSLRKILHGLGLKDAASFVCPQAPAGFERTMVKRFGWIPSWKGFRVT